jgi:hypothetical protein
MSNIQRNSDHRYEAAKTKSSMSVNLKTRSDVFFEKHPNFRIVQVSGRAGKVGMHLPHANLLVPDKDAIRNLSEIMELYKSLKLTAFNYGAGSDYERSGQPEVPNPKRKLPFEMFEGLPLLEDL